MQYKVLFLCTACALMLGCIVWYVILKYKYKKIKLKCYFCPTDLESVFEQYRQYKGIEISGILGNDFFKRYKYIIDYKNNKVHHGLNSMSIKGWMDLIDIPGVTLYQGENKYHFLLDTGATNSHISQKALQTLKYETRRLKEDVPITGMGGEQSINYMIKSILYYHAN